MGSGLFRCEARLTTEKDPLIKYQTRFTQTRPSRRGRAARLRHDAVMLSGEES